MIKDFLNARHQEATLPTSLPREVFMKLPQKPGVYYFKDKKGKIIYVGKAINIKKRVLSHFYDKANKEVQLCAQTADIDFELSGNELLALLMESSAIKHHYPLFNRAQKRKVQPYGVFSYQDRQGVMHIAYNKLKLAPPMPFRYTTALPHVDFLSKRFVKISNYAPPSTAICKKTLLLARIFE